MTTPSNPTAMTEIVVLEEWKASLFHLRLVSDGYDIWVEYQPTFSDGLKFWRKDNGMATCDEDTANHILPHFSVVNGITLMDFAP